MMRLFPRKITRVILDTNVTLLPGQGIDIFTELDVLLNETFDLFVIEETFDELRRISEGKAGKNPTDKVKGKDKQNAKLAFIMLNHKRVRQLKNKGPNVDDSIVLYSNRNTIVVTLDKKLQERVQGEHARVITIKHKRLNFL